MMKEKILFMKDINSQKMDEFLEDLQAPVFPGPASGSACAVSVAMAAALLGMSVEATRKKKEVSGEDVPSAQQIYQWRQKSMELATKDMQAYDKVVKAQSLKKEEPDEYDRIMAEATVTLVEIMECSAEILKSINSFLTVSFNKVIGDLAGAASLAYGAAIGCNGSVEINSKLIKGQEARASIIRIKEDHLNGVNKSKSRIDQYLKSVI
ncbi:MAG TPA: hypothetical protein DHN33_10545 [Eubacteriaceae bacterium]|nr:hypothetical protein [Eubacteriaceae bacterium]